MWRAVLVAVVAVGACASPLQAPPFATGQPLPPSGGAQPGRGLPPLGVFPPNETRVVGRVLAATGSSVTLEILDARPARPDIAMGPAVGTIDAVARDPIDRALVGRRIEAVLTLIGDTRSSRWLVTEIRTLPD
jgi:hypothetical protein